MTRPFMDHKLGEQALLDINLIMNFRRIPYFLIQGTALGAYRDQGFTPTERDIDLGILIENFLPAWWRLKNDLQEYGFEVTTRDKPFNRVRILVAKRGGVKVDITTYVPWKKTRFCANTDPALDYAVVYHREMIECYDFVSLFGSTFRVPQPIEQYLELEYGEDWRTPQDDSVSRTRHYHFVKSERIPRDYLDQFEKGHTSSQTG